MTPHCMLLITLAEDLQVQFLLACSLIRYARSTLGSASALLRGPTASGEVCHEDLVTSCHTHLVSPVDDIDDSRRLRTELHPSQPRLQRLRCRSRHRPHSHQSLGTLP